MHHAAHGHLYRGRRAGPSPGWRGVGDRGGRQRHTDNLGYGAGPGAGAVRARARPPPPKAGSHGRPRGDARQVHGVRIVRQGGQGKEEGPQGQGPRQQVCRVCKGGPPRKAGLQKVRRVVPRLGHGPGGAKEPDHHHIRQGRQAAAQQVRPGVHRRRAALLDNHRPRRDGGHDVRAEEPRAEESPDLGGRGAGAGRGRDARRQEGQIDSSIPGIDLENVARDPPFIHPNHGWHVRRRRRGQEPGRPCSVR